MLYFILHYSDRPSEHVMKYSLDYQIFMFQVVGRCIACAYELPYAEQEEFESCKVEANVLLHEFNYLRDTL